MLTAGGNRMTVFKKRPFMYKLGAWLFRWIRECALYEFSKANGTLFDVSAFKGGCKIKQKCEDEIE